MKDYFFKLLKLVTQNDIHQMPAFSSDSLFCGLPRTVRAWEGGDVSVAVAIPTWSVEHRILKVEEFIRNNKSILAATRAFCQRFKIQPCDIVPKRDMIELGA